MFLHHDPVRKYSCCCLANISNPAAKRYRFSVGWWEPSDAVFLLLACDSSRLSDIIYIYVIEAAAPLISWGYDLSFEHWISISAAALGLKFYLGWFKQLFRYCLVPTAIKVTDYLLFDGEAMRQMLYFVFLTTATESVRSPSSFS